MVARQHHNLLQNNTIEPRMMPIYGVEALQSLLFSTVVTFSLGMILQLLQISSQNRCDKLLQNPNSQRSSWDACGVFSRASWDDPCSTRGFLLLHVYETLLAPADLMINLLRKNSINTLHKMVCPQDLSEMKASTTMNSNEDSR